MRRIALPLLAAVVAPAFTACSCSRCEGLGTEVAMISGRHSYAPYKPYKKGETIPCLKCNGTGKDCMPPGPASFGPLVNRDAFFSDKRSHSATEGSVRAASAYILY